ncbi:MAG: [protein-PII] uridylyltransferase [Cellvibrionales bacterium]|nr:[protein-PII] uridylyltransferase [Cellvibrionales bacterium]
MFARRKTRHQCPEFGTLFFFDERAFAAATQQAGTSAVPFKRALRNADEHLNQRLNEGETVHKLIRDRAAFIDRLLYYAWQRYPWDADIALFAVGGYGRGDMHPHSDLDLLFLLRHNTPRRYQNSIQQFLAFLWDLQLTIGHSTRTAKQCRIAARADPTIMTNLLERRLLIGPQDLAHRLDHQLENLWPAPQFFAAKLAEQKARHARHGITEFDLEPNVKESPGGLRDIQTLQWVAHRAYGVGGLKKLAARGFCTEEEYNSLTRARAFLWRVRYCLHSLARRPREQLDFATQRQLADKFGYRDTPERLAVEQFMQHYYLTAASVREITDVLMQLLAADLDPATDQTLRPLNPRFQLRGNYLETTAPDTFAHHPAALIEIFLILARDRQIHGLHGQTIRQLRESGHRIDAQFRANPEHRRLFTELLRSPENLAHALQLMSRYAILGRYLPEFGAIMGLTQHDLFHIYPVDIHTLALLRNLHDFTKPAARQTHPIAHHTMTHFPRPELLIVAGLYHDIAKGRGGDHSELGAIEVARFAKDHAFSKWDTKLLIWLVKNHLFMSRVAQREDISDPEIIATFARQVRDETRLNLLYTLTAADILATNPTLWNSWRATLMRQLYDSTRRLLRRGLHQAPDRQELITETRDKALYLLHEKGIAKPSYAKLWADLGDSYFQRESPADIAWHTELLLTDPDTPNPLVTTKPLNPAERDRATVLFLRTRRSALLFYAAARALSRAGLNIQDARLYAAGPFSFLTLYVLDENAHPINQDRARLDRLQKTLRRELHPGHRRPTETAPRPTRRRLRQFPVKTQTNLLTANGQSILEVITADRAGLLAAIAEQFIAHQVTLKSAKITTLGERVEDLFVIETANGTPLPRGPQATHLEQTIRATIDQKVDASTQI